MFLWGKTHVVTKVKYNKNINNLSINMGQIILNCFGFLGTWLSVFP